MKYKYEIHCHTSETSRCSNLSGAELAEFYKDAGYNGIIVSDHFFNGNTTIPRNTGIAGDRKYSWEERVELFCMGYENAYRRGVEIGIDVFFSWEYSYLGADYLTYGLDKEWLLANSDIESLPITDYFKRVREAGAFIIHAHPFRQAEYISGIFLFPERTEAVEVINSSMSDIVNFRAKWYADNYNLINVAGSDTHYKNKTYLSAMVYGERLKDIKDFINKTRNKEFYFENIDL